MLHSVHDRLLMFLPHTIQSVPHQTVFAKTLLDQVPIGILQLGLDGRITHANPAFCQLIGYTEAHLQHLGNRAISHPDDFVVEVRLLQQMLDHSQPQQQPQQVLPKRYYRSNGDIVWTEVSLTVLQNAEIGEATILSFITNVSDRRQIEQTLWQDREREILLADISMQLRTTADLQAIMQTAVERLQQILLGDRVLAYQFFPDHSGICLAEAAAPYYPLMRGQTFLSNCVPPAVSGCVSGWTVVGNN